MTYISGIEIVFLVLAACSRRSAFSGGPRAARGRTAPSNTSQSTRTLTRTNSPVGWEILTCRRTKNDEHALCPLTFDTVVEPNWAACSHLFSLGFGSCEVLAAKKD